MALLHGFWRNSTEGFMADLLDVGFQTGRQGFACRLQMDDLAAPVSWAGAALDEAIEFQTIDQSHDGRAFDAHHFGELALRKPLGSTMQAQQHAPFGSGEAVRAELRVFAQLGVKSLTPPVGGAGEQFAEFFVSVGQKGDQLLE